MSKQKGYARNIFFSIIISLLVLLALGYLSVRYLVPIYDIQSQDIYRFLIYLLPVLIGFVLIQIGAMISHKGDDKIEDIEDLLPKNSYDAPLFETINDDPSEKRASATLTPITKMEKAPTVREYSIEDFLDKEVASCLKRYDTTQILNIFNEFEADKPKIIESPFNEEITSELSSFSNEEIIKALRWLENGSNDVPTSGYVFENINEESVNRFQNISQNEADFAIEILDKKLVYNNLISLSDENLNAISKLTDAEIELVLQMLANDSKVVPFDNLDKDTIARILDYNSVQVNVGLDYIDLGAPDIVDSDYISLNNLDKSTKERLQTTNNSLINQGLDILENSFVNSLSLNTIQRLNNYNDDQIINALDYIEESPTVVEDLPFDEELNNSIRKFSYEEAQVAVDFINNPENYIKDKEPFEALPFGEKLNNEILSLSLDQASSAIDYIKNQDEYTRVSEIVEDLPFGNEINNAIRNFTYEDALNAVDFVNNNENYIKSDEIIEDLPFGDEINNAIRNLTRSQAINAINYINSPDAGHLPFGLDINHEYNDVEDDTETLKSIRLPFSDEINEAIINFTPEQAMEAVNYVNNPIAVDDQYGDLSNNLEDFLNSEINDNENFNFDISLVMFDKANVLEEERKEDILKALPPYTYKFKTNDNITSIIFPYDNLEKTKATINEILETNSLFLEDNFVDVGYSSKNNRKVDAKLLIDEARN